MNLQYIVLFCVAFIVTKATAPDPLGERMCYTSICCDSKVSESNGTTSCSCSVEEDPSTLTQKKCIPKKGRICICFKRVIYYIDNGKWNVFEVTRSVHTSKYRPDVPLTMRHEVETLVPGSIKAEFWSCFEDGCNL